MTEREYRRDDRNDGYCPVCAKPLTGLTRAARGYCEQHGWQWAEWQPVVTIRVVDTETGEEVPMVSGPAITWEGP